MSEPSIHGKKSHEHHDMHPQSGGHEHKNHEHKDHHTSHDHSVMVAEFKRRFWVSIALTGPILLLSPMIQSALGLEELLAFRASPYVLFLLSSVVFFYGGLPFLKGLFTELQKREPGMMTLIALAISVSYFYSSGVVFGLAGKVFFWELATLIDVMLLGHWIEMKSVMGASGALEALVRLMPREARRIKSDGSTEDVPVTELNREDRVIIKPGEKAPTDGIVMEGETSVNESMLTGESRPVPKEKGDKVIGGSVNGEGSITMEVTQTGGETYLSQVIEMVRQAQMSRSRTQDLANRAARWLTYIALSVGFVTLGVWLAIGDDPEYALARMVTVMVITCPHALGLAAPLVVAVSASLGASNGLLIRNRAAFERARRLDAIVFDKTGTLTEGRFGVTDIEAAEGLGEQEVLRLAASLESHSEHPIAQGVTAAAKEKGIELLPVSEFRNLTGQGAEASVDGRRLKVVSPSYLRKEGISADGGAPARWMDEGKTVVYVLRENEVAGAIALADIIRPESRQAIDSLKGMGIRCMMLTGDSEAVARTVAGELGLDEYFAEVLPDEKSRRVREVKERGLKVAMVGDGVNDAPALVEADLGVAIGAGTDVAVESADVVLVRDDPRDVAAIMSLSRATYGKMIQNLAWATGYNVIAIPLAAGVGAGFGVVLSPAVGAALMSASTVIVAINAKLLGRFKK